jgi:hypothetical protein
MPSAHSNIDFIAYDRQGHVVLLAEAKSRRGTSEQWAAGLRKNMLSHGLLPLAKYFLIATPERLYFWNQEHPERADAAPEYTIDAAREFQPWFQKLSLEPSDIGPEAFELLVHAWLNGIAGSGEGLSHHIAAPWLEELTGSLQQARIEMNPIQ